MLEFYFRNQDDPNYNPDILEVSDEIEALIYQVKMILLTNRGEVLGDPGFGCNLDLILYDTYLDFDSLEQYLKKQVMTYCEIARKYNIDIKVKKIADTSYRDIGIIDVVINDKSLFGVLI